MNPVSNSQLRSGLAQKLLPQFSSLAILAHCGLTGLSTLSMSSKDDISLIITSVC